MSINESEVTSCCNDKLCQPIEKKQPEKQSDKKGCNDNKGCNPLQTCKTCIALSNEFVCLNFSPVILLSKPQTENNVKFLPQITLDFWQPPKIA